MRSASYNFRMAVQWALLIVGLLAFAALVAPAQQTINPHTQIRWPAGCAIYNVSANACPPVGSIVFRGAWSSSTTYAANDAVSISGSTYVSLQNGNLNHNPTSSPTFWTLLVAGGVLPSATSAGQIISSTSAGNAYGLQAQLFYSQPSDTVTSIEAECSSNCAYHVTTSQTITLSGNHTLSSNVMLVFENGAGWTVNGAFTLTIGSGVVVAPPVQVFGGSANVNGLGMTPVSPLWFAGADIDAQINKAWPACGNDCPLQIPPTTFNSITTTINFPVATNGKAALICAPMATFNYTGSGDWLTASGTGQGGANIVVSGCLVNGTSAGVSGVHTIALNKAIFTDVKVFGFTTGSGFLQSGSNGVTCNSCEATGNKYGNHNVGIVVGGQNYAANGNIWHDGALGANTTQGSYDDATLAGTVGPNQGNGYYATIFEDNGTSGVATTGHVFIERCDGCFIRDSFFEYFAGTKDHAIKINVSTDTVTLSHATVLAGNKFYENSATISTATIVDNGDATNVGPNNAEYSAVPHLVFSGPNAGRRTIYPNECLACTGTLFAGQDNVTLDFWAGGLQNSMLPTVRGLQFQSIVGQTIAGIILRLAPGASNYLRCDNDSFQGLCQIDNAGHFVGQGFNAVETTAVAGIAGEDICGGNSTTHMLQCNFNNQGTYNVASILNNAANNGNCVSFFVSGNLQFLQDSGSPCRPLSNAISSATGGSGTGAVACVTAACTNLRGSYTVAGGTFATGTLLTLVWPTTTAANVCSASVLNNATGESIGYHSVATATGMTISALTSATGLTVDIDYSCQP